MFMLLMILLGNDRPTARARAISEVIDGMATLLVFGALFLLILVVFA